MHRRKTLIAGVDEAGRGPLAGPVVCAAVILPTDWQLPGLNDSKKLSEAAREILFSGICTQALAYSIVEVDLAQIERLNILHASLWGMQQCLQALQPAAELALIDGNRLPENLPCPARAMVRGDASEPCIMAASILAKVSRDRIMHALHHEYPEYGFDRHKGYPTAKHLNALRQYGVSPIHRRHFGPVSALLPRQSALP
jgi:ribonuclease HII